MATAINLFGTIIGWVNLPTFPGFPPGTSYFSIASFVRSPAGAIRYFQAPEASHGGTYAQYIDAFGDIAGFSMNEQSYGQSFVESSKGRFAFIAPQGAEQALTTLTGLGDLGEATGYYPSPCQYVDVPNAVCYRNFVRDARGTITSFDFPVDGEFPYGGGLAVGINAFGVVVGSFGPSAMLRVPY